jgi:predicted N-acyltransferase
LEWWAKRIQKTINRALLAQSSITMGKLKEYHFGNKSFKDYEDDFLDEDYYYAKWQKDKNKKAKRRQKNEGEYGDEWEDGVDE